jgi:hypothetical protein
MSEKILAPHTMRHSIGDWLEKMASGLELGRFRFCSEGSYVPTKGQSGQMATCFAMKIAWQTGIWESWDEKMRIACVDFVKSFQTSEGWFKDPWLAANVKPDMKDYLRVLSGRCTWSSLQNRLTESLRAETRQSAATLLMVEASPKFPLPLEVTSGDDVVRYVQVLDWRNPWGAASHVSHQLFMLAVNKKCFGVPRDYEQFIDIFLEQLSKYYDPATGTWYQGNPSDDIKINGSMKVFSGLQWLDRPYPDTRVLLDFSLKQPFESDGCGFLNRLFVVYQAQKGVEEGYRAGEIKKLAQDALKRVVEFRHADGSFPFYKDKAQTRYYSACVSKGLPLSDLHGTTMFTWAIALCLELLGEDAPEGAEVWKAHKA